MKKITVLGAGTWGCALTILLANNGHDVTLWSAMESEINNIGNDRNKIKGLPDATMPNQVKLTLNLDEATNDKDIIVFAVASPYIRQTANKVKTYIKNKQIIVNVAKGIEESTLNSMSDIISQEIPQADVAVLSGPTHAEEVSRGIPTTIVVGANSIETAKYIQDAFMSEVFRVYTSPDIIGIEIGASLKNVIALAAGIADGLGYGDNTKSALMTRGIAEITRLGIKLGGKTETFYGLSGVGDLFVTCTSMHSRNRKAGYLIGQGLSMDQAMKEVNQIVEGVYSAKAAYALANKNNVEMPIVEQINQVLFEGKSPDDAVTDLLMRDRTKEHSALEWD
ncbi:MAG TPA: NAD(P)H-dependent glycerol-3-phosphate dehydrogenase [Clostridiales bacterium]|nr:NAD(P)H-dependent glycerol-3-phosphate dehydrogenase [Clostridiales bacterium]